jgi:hypothetical protein
MPGEHPSCTAHALRQLILAGLGARERVPDPLGVLEH